ncbi:MAG: AraC family transcriptional regulator [Clostridia bacterium]|nr:AraC family transcriptional regulator [Clostridia bacterium]
MAIKPFYIERLLDIKCMYSFFLRYFEKGYVFKGEVHNFWECMYVRSGEILASADNRVYNLTAGDIIFHKPMEFHKFSVESCEGAEILVFTYECEDEFAYKMKNKVFSLNEASKSIVDALYNYAYNEYIKYFPNVPKTAYNDMLSVSSFDNKFLPRVETYICQLIYSLADSKSKNDTVVGTDSLIFSNAVSLMKQNINKDFSVKELSKELNVSESTLKRVFQKYADAGIHKYFLMLKIRTATKFLEEGMGVGEVSDKLGFTSPAYFSSCFKRVTGMKPSEISKNALKAFGSFIS